MFKRVIFLILILGSLLLAPAPAAASQNSPHLIREVLSDLRVLYIYDQPQTIDWPTLYYLNVEHGCRVDLLTAEAQVEYAQLESRVSGRQLFHTQYWLRTDSNNTTLAGEIDSLLSSVFSDRAPDLVIVGNLTNLGITRSVVEAVTNRPADSNSLFDMGKILEVKREMDSSEASSNYVSVNSRELIQNYGDFMTLEIPSLFPWFHLDLLEDNRLIRYKTITTQASPGHSGPSFLAGLESLRLVSVLDSLLSESATKRSFINKASNFISFYSLAQASSGAVRAENLIAGYRTLTALADQVRTHSSLSRLPELVSYIERLEARAQTAMLSAIGIDWDGSILLRDSPHGPTLKFRANLTINGPRPVEISYIRFQPYWDESEILLDSMTRVIRPHQSFVREYLVDIDRQHLEAEMPERLTFAAEIAYGGSPLKVKSSLPIWERPDLQVRFEPDFIFVPPAARVDVDKVVSSMTMKAVVTKPLYYSGQVTVSLQTPRGVFAGAYRQEMQLERGQGIATVRIPFSVSNLFELGTHSQNISLLVEGQPAASDTGIIRIASCEVSDTITVGMLADSSGRLEDILNMARVTYRPLTDRTLQTGDLEAYNVILIGSGAMRTYPTLRKIKGRLEDFVRYGGSLVLLGQPTDWPDGALPFSLVPSIERVSASDLLNHIPTARILTRPYTISTSGLESELEDRQRVAAALVSPAEPVYLTPSGATLLSVSRLGEGQMIFCGFPLIEMISELNIDAIHLLANILNY